MAPWLDHGQPRLIKLAMVDHSQLDHPLTKIAVIVTTDQPQQNLNTEIVFAWLLKSS